MVCISLWCGKVFRFLELEGIRREGSLGYVFLEFYKLLNGEVSLFVKSNFVLLKESCVEAVVVSFLYCSVTI